MPKAQPNGPPKATRSPRTKPPPHSARRRSSSKSTRASPSYDSAAEDIIISEDETLDSSTLTPNRLRTHGRRVLVGQDVWSRFISDDSVIVDKSMAIERIMTKGCTVLTGLAPRGFGKTTFLTMLREFLSAESAVPKEKRLHVFKDYELFHRNQPFFHEHFARYPVFYMDFKTVEVNSPDEAFYTIASKIIEISRPYISLLKTHLSDKRLWNDKGQFYSVDEKVSLINSILEKYDGLYDFARPYAKMETRQFLPQLMSVLSKYPGGANSVIIIDNYDTPGYHAITKLVGYSNGIADTLMRDQILHEFSAFYNELFKNNSYLKIGVLAGVYNIPLYHKRPGRIDYKVFQPHHGVGSSSDSSNPFDAAFGLSETETWELICDHVERRSARSTPAFKFQFKKDLMSYIFKTVNHNTYGTKQYCFNTRSVIRFIEAIEGYDTLAQIQGSILDHQIPLRETLDTNSLHIVEPQRFRQLIEGPILEYMTRRLYHFGSPSTAGTLETEIQSEGIAMLSQSAFTNVPFMVDGDALTSLVHMCLSVDQSRILECSAAGLCLESAFSQLYQAGYLVLVNGHVCVANNEAFEALLAILHSRCADPGHRFWTLSPVLYDTGIHNGDLIKFARFIDKHLAARPEFPLTHPVETYLCFISALLMPLKYQGCTINTELSPSDGGMADIVIMSDVANDSGTDPASMRMMLPQIVIKVQAPLRPKSMLPNHGIPLQSLTDAFDQVVGASDVTIGSMRSRRLNFAPLKSVLHTHIVLTFMYNRFFFCSMRYVGNPGEATKQWRPHPYRERDIRGVASTRIGYNTHNGLFIASTYLGQFAQMQAP